MCWAQWLTPVIAVIQEAKAGGLSFEASLSKKGKKKVSGPCLKNNSKPEPVAHTCNPSYSGGRDQYDHGSKPTQANSSRAPILKTSYKKRLVERLKV
jgi:hypothetical protein